MTGVQTCALPISDLSRSVYDIFNRRQRQQSHWASGVKFLGADSDFGAVAEFEGLGIGTVAAAFTMGKGIVLMGKLLDKKFAFVSVLSPERP